MKLTKEEQKVIDGLSNLNVPYNKIQTYAQSAGVDMGFVDAYVAQKYAGPIMGGGGGSGGVYKTHMGYITKHEILDVKWYGTVGFVAIASGKPGSGEWKVYCDQIPNFGTPQDDANYIADNGNKIPDWQVASALFPNLDSQLFIW